VSAESIKAPGIALTYHIELEAAVGPSEIARRTISLIHETL
jgi:hypothetical protein